MSNNSKVKELIPKPLSKEQLSDIWSMIDGKTVDRIVIEPTKEFILIERPARSDEEDQVIEKAIHSAIRQAEMEEYEPSGDGGGPDTVLPFQKIFEMARVVEQEGFEVSCILAGTKAKLQSWLGIRLPRNAAKILGIPVFFSGDIPPEAIIVCGAPWKDSDAKYIQFSVKGDMT